MAEPRSQILHCLGVGALTGSKSALHLLCRARALSIGGSPRASSLLYDDYLLGVAQVSLYGFMQHHASGARHNCFALLAPDRLCHRLKVLQRLWVKLVHY